MKKNAKSIFGYLFSVIIAAVLLFLVFKNISFDEFIAQAESANYSWVYLSIALTPIAHIARAYRWNLLINPLGYQATTTRTTAAVLVGYIVNLVLPRLGEVTRCGVLKKTDGVPMTISVGSVISERIIDVLVLFLITAVTLVIQFDKLSSFLLSMFGSIDTRGLIIMALSAVALAILGIAAVYWLYNRLEGRFRVVLGQLFEGLFSLRKIDNIKGFLASTLLLWVTYFFMGYVIFFVVAETSDLGWKVGMMMLVCGSIAMTIPVQGGFGTFHSIVGSMLLLYGIDKTTGVFFATLVHSSQVVATVIYGVIGLIMTIFLKGPARENQE